MFIKEAIVSTGRRLFSEKQAEHLENGILMQFLFFTTV